MTKNLTLPEIRQRLQASQKIVLTPHIHPDGDCLGSMLGLYHVLKSQYKEVSMLLDDEVPKSFHFLPGQEEICQPENPIDADLLVIVDASDLERIGQVRNMVKAPTLNIDHHISNVHFADYLYLDPDAAATGEIIYDLVKEMIKELPLESAICLYTAIATDCGFFRFSNTQAKTMKIAAQLIEAGVKPYRIAESLEVRSVESLQIMAQVLQTLQFYQSGKIAAISVSEQIMAKGKDHTEGLVQYPRSLEGVDVAVMFKEVDQQTLRVSMRSHETDVSEVALQFGGGGHKRAAGCTLLGPVEESKQKLINQLIKTVQEASL